MFEKNVVMKRTEKEKSSETAIWEKFIKENDREAYEYIYKKYVQPLFFYFLRFTTDRELIRDCIQDVFVKLYHHRSNLLLNDGIHYYLFTSLKNTLLNHFRDQKTQVAIEDCEPYLVSERTVEENFVEDETDSLRKAKVDTILGLLPARQRDAMRYRYIEEKKIEEIAKMMNMNRQSVSNLLQRAIQKIKTEYKLMTNVF
jgi:RNA polymerase sigma factor (sigma-70 family)